MNNSINIYVAGKNIAGILESVASPPGISCRVFALETGTRITPHAVNVFILRRLPGKIISGAKYILCSKSHDSLTPETLGTLYDLWPEPMTPSLLRFHYAKLLERIALEQLTTSEETEHQKRILEMARQDYLTGLATRWYLHEYIRRNQDEQNVTCIYLDLDNFKKVNDTYGHQAGDRALAATAEMMQQKFSDGFCARMGGDEFMIVLLGMREISDVAEKVSTFMAGLMEYYAGTKTMRALSVSAGISQKTHGDGKSIDQLIHESDMALYEAKKSGRACCKVYNPSLEERNNDDSDTEGRKYYLVDFENVHSAGLDGIHKLDADSTVCYIRAKFWDDGVQSRNKIPARRSRKQERTRFSALVIFRGNHHGKRREKLQVLYCLKRQRIFKPDSVLEGQRDYRRNNFGHLRPGSVRSKLAGA